MKFDFVKRIFKDYTLRPLLVHKISPVILCVISVILLPILAETSPQPLIVHFLDVGYGDAIVLRLPEGKTILVDGGRPEEGQKVSAILRDLGIHKLNYVVITHFHKDHAGGLASVRGQSLNPTSLSKTDRLEGIFIPMLPETVEPEVEIVKARIQQLSYRIVRRGKILPISTSVKLDVLHPETLKGDPNEDSLVLMLTHGQVKIFFTGDIGLEAQKELVQIYGSRLKSDVMKVPHHGGEVLEEFIEAVSPREAILSVGPNPYGSPKPEVLDWYSKKGILVHRTDLVGNITAISDGLSLEVHQGLHP